MERVSVGSLIPYAKNSRTHTDEQVGKVMAKLEELGIRDNTLVIVLSDHGEPFGEHGTIRKYGAPIYDELAKMVFMVSLPGVVPQGTMSDALVQNTDFAVTLASFLDLELPPARGEADRWNKGYDGLDLVPLIRGEVESVRDTAYIGAFNLHAGLRRGPWKFIDNQGRKPNELYNLDADPKERNNRIDDEKTLAVELHRRVGEFRSRWSVTLSWRDKPVGQ